MRNLADVKRRCKLGVVVTMTQHDLLPNGKLINVPREIVHVQTNAIQFAGGSWLYWPKAGQVTVEDHDKFSIMLNPQNQSKMHYQIINN